MRLGYKDSIAILIYNFHAISSHRLHPTRMPTTMKHCSAIFLVSMIPVNGNLDATSEFAAVDVWVVSPAPPSLVASNTVLRAAAADWLDPKLTLDTDSAAAITHANLAATLHRFRACVTGRTGSGRTMNQWEVS